MKIIFLLIQKEFRQILRNRSILPLILVVPILQLLILPLAASFEIKEIKLHVVDLDNSPSSRELTSKFNGSPFFKIVNTSKNYEIAERDIIRNQADMLLQIPLNMEKDLLHSGSAKVQLTINAINSTAAALNNGYSASIIADYNAGIAVEISHLKPSTAIESPTLSFWYNPQLDYPTYMVPGILVMLVAIIGLFLSSMNMVREKEMGTIEQINVTPIRKYQFIIGKFFPFWVFALIDASIGLVLARLVYGIPIVGSVALIYLLLIVFLLAVLGVGLFFSAISNTQQQAMFMAWFFVMIFILLSGLFTPEESMPDWARHFNTINPFAYAIKAIRMIMLKGSTFADVQREFFALIIYSFVSISLAIRAYRKTV